MIEVVKRWKESTNKSGLYSNFGELWHRANARISQMHGRHAYVCSSGTDAVRLAVYAAVKKHDTAVDNIYCEPFTFEGTFRAAEDISWLLFGKRLRAIPTERSLVVATVPFGRWRHFNEWKDRPLVIDAAGAYQHDAKAFVKYPFNAPIAVSFHATKNYPIGEGGAVMLPLGWLDECEDVREAMNFGFSCSDGAHADFGTNAKIDELRCSVLFGQLERHHFFSHRSAIIGALSSTYQAALGGNLQYVAGRGQSLAVVNTRAPVSLIMYMRKCGIAAKRVYMPHRQSWTLSSKQRQYVALPSDPTPDEVTHITRALRRFARGKRK